MSEGEHDVSAVIYSIMKVIAATTFNTYTPLVAVGLMTGEQAADALRRDADRIEALRIPVPDVGASIAEDMRGFAAAFEPRQARKTLSIVTPGGVDV